MPLPYLMIFKDSPISHLKSSKHFIFYMHTQDLVLSTNNVYRCQGLGYILEEFIPLWIFWVCVFMNIYLLCSKNQWQSSKKLQLQKLLCRIWCVVLDELLAQWVLSHYANSQKNKEEGKQAVLVPFSAAAWRHGIITLNKQKGILKLFCWF